ncbi:unnamed protein product [Vitrella brassicaformis CCMP3155]|uniref:Uncharacterized protein n=2 Tax=Vitrella brassicaformis TaxID=1169539 RepID=A0A0G4GQY8_VITBC|nr:unnamed protein product [Vitrella brassicaformis CCMP3155]|eukprot:CEM32868.1 unnamed protein product [Vitrella brassicaformis CCMP3155]
MATAASNDVDATTILEATEGFVSVPATYCFRGSWNTRMMAQSPYGSPGGTYTPSTTEKKDHGDNTYLLRSLRRKSKHYQPIFNKGYKHTSEK